MEKEKLMRIGLAITAILSLAILSGCSSTSIRPIEISATPIEKPQLILPPADQLSLKDIEWIIINKENVEEVFAQLQADKKDPALIGLSDEGYELLSLNYSDIMAYIQQQNAIITAYRNYYEKSEQALEDANAQIEGAKAEVDAQNNAPAPESTLDKLNPFK